MSLEQQLELNVIKEQVKNFASFSLGQKKIEELTPSYEPLVLRQENERSREALAAVVHYGTMPFDGIRDIEQSLQNAKKGRTLTPQELSQEINLIHGLSHITAYEKMIEEDHPALKDLTSTITIHKNTAAKLESCIDAYGEIRDSASADLRNIRSSLRHADADVQAAVTRFMHAHPDSIVDSIVSYRNDRAVILVKASDKNSFHGFVYGDSASGQASYIEPPEVIAANNRKAQLQEQEAREIHRILVECTKEVGKIADEEIGNLETAGILDAIFARAQWGAAHDACVATLTQERRLSFEKARHPLIDPKKVVANNYHLEEPQHMLLITGPNTGGKTVSMKIIGLFTLMSYCGIPIPCDSAVIPYFDAVYADIGDDQSVVSSLSSFSAHVEKQARALASATSQSLVLLDEIGSGTDPREGEALAIAILNELRIRKTMTVATTHYSRLKSYGKRHPDVLLASVEFDMEKLAPTYRYLEGTTGSSNALEIAGKYGLPKSVIKEARFLKDQARSQEDVLLEQLDKELSRQRATNEQLEAKLKEIRTYQQQLKTQQIEFQKERDEWKAHADEEAEAITEEAKEQADAILKRMRKMQQNAKYHEVLAERQKLNRNGAEREDTSNNGQGKNNNPDPNWNSSTQKTQAPPAFQVGDTVELRVNGQAAKVVRIERKEILIDLNGREMRVKPDTIRPSLKVIPKIKADPEVHIAHASIFEAFSPECNLIGMHVDEAVEKLQSYVSDAKIHGLKEFRIIHGDGSGALRKAVHEQLSAMKDVQSFTLARPEHGGSGATVVKLK